jgi:hypothetical protein
VESASQVCSGLMLINQAHVASNALSVVGTFALVVYAFPWLGLAFIPLGICYVRGFPLMTYRALTGD